ncbi:capsule synthesis protein, capa [Chryseotalea sanaruensis]|uniref:Capsule synthesis protein, capa n=1 Tax=Chryseotalea sanaruensis TaxID=2482724 RepID=A0A401U6N8_9BACT|nr:CapA family protein [Chryseotalea sanaruensis]GCC50539.1 capsule synthesis protein, capa [Chryseotalea sanaruensis]
MRLSVFFFIYLLLSTTAFSQSKDTLTIIGVGDIMMGTNYPENRLPANNGAFLMKDVEAVLKNADVTFGNLEGTLLDEGGTPKTCRDPKVCYAFRTPVAYVDNLVNAGFDLLSLANNHAGDMGDLGRKSSMQTLEDAGILHAGQLNQKTVIFIKDSIKYGLVAFAPNSNCVPLNDLAGAKELVKQLDTKVDVVIVSFHGGAEGPQYQHVPRNIEMFYGENRGDVYKFAHELIDVGADVIFGHGPHVTRGIEVYKNRFIAYSLGNFCTYRGINVSGINGLAPIVKIYTSKEGEFLKGEITPTIQNHTTGVQIDSLKRVTKVIQELSKKDFPESPVRIAENGLITYLAQ